MTAMAETALPPDPRERTLLIVEDDKSFLTRLARALEARGFTVIPPKLSPTGAQVDRRRRSMRWSTCGSATATGSMSSRR